MLNTIKIPMIFLALVAVVLMPKASYAWDNQNSRSDGHAQHGHRYYANDLTLVSGMDNIDSRVLVDPAPDPAPEVTYQPAPEAVAPIPSQVMNPDANGDFIVNVPNNAGGYTPIRIQKSGDGYLGPQGELYYPFPEVSQLKAMYGL